MSVHKTQAMTVKVTVEDGESIDLALRKLSRKVKSEMDRRWYKRRFGYYEKPSVLKRKSKKMEKLAIQSGGTLWLIFQKWQFGGGPVIVRLFSNNALKALTSFAGTGEAGPLA